MIFVILFMILSVHEGYLAILSMILGDCFYDTLQFFLIIGGFLYDTLRFYLILGGSLYDTKQ